jgi:ABC-type transport system involved in multi-copper enzyme maturation permease subunit
MIWLTWRQHRKQLLFVFLVVAALAALLVPVGLRMHSALTDSGLAACIRALGGAEWIPLFGMDCEEASSGFGDRYAWAQLPAVLMLLFPMFLGVFFGAPLVSREVEQGTHRLVWTQGITRRRWLATKLVLFGVGAIIISIVYTALTTWWLDPVSQGISSRFTFPFFDLYGVVPVGYALFAIALGVFVGTVSRKTMTAMAWTIVGFAAVRIAGNVLVRPNLIEPLERRFPVVSDKVPNPWADDWVLSRGIYDAQGNLVVADGMRLCPPDARIQCTSTDVNVWTYQPGDRFWLFQYLETGIYLALAAVLIALAVRQVRRRIT